MLFRLTVGLHFDRLATVCTSASYYNYQGFFDCINLARSLRIVPGCDSGESATKSVVSRPHWEVCTMNSPIRITILVADSVNRKLCTKHLFRHSGVKNSLKMLIYEK